MGRAAGYARIPVANAFFVLLIVAAVRVRTMPQSLCWTCRCLPLIPTLYVFPSPPLSHFRGPRRAYCQVYAIIGTNFFSKRTPEHFSNFHTSLFTMFQVMSGGASMYLVRACVLLCKRVVRVLVCCTHMVVCVRASRGRDERGRVNTCAWKAFGEGRRREVRARR
jgi:hypothetical protein